MQMAWKFFAAQDVRDKKRLYSYGEKLKTS